MRSGRPGEVLDDGFTLVWEISAWLSRRSDPLSLPFGLKDVEITIIMSDVLSVDDLLAAQSKGTNLATIEPIEGKVDMAKVTPWVPGVGCLCQLALAIPKMTIESVRRTGDLHHCCGKVLFVVEVRFTKDSTISLDELYAQVMSAAFSHQRFPTQTGLSSIGSPAAPQLIQGVPSPAMLSRTQELRTPPSYAAGMIPPQGSKTSSVQSGVAPLVACMTGASYCGGDGLCYGCCNGIWYLLREPFTGVPRGCEYGLYFNCNGVNYGAYGCWPIA